MGYLTSFAGLPVADFRVESVPDELYGVSFAAELRDLARRYDDPNGEITREIELFVERLRFLAHLKIDEELRNGPPVAWRVRADDETPFGEVFESFLHQIDTFHVSALVIGFWGALHDDDRPNPVDLLVKVADRFPGLRSLFLGDISAEEQELSWITHSDITPLFEAFPRLRRLEVRGGGGLRLDPIRSDALMTLRFESGGLPARVVRAVAASELPNLERLELWLGIGGYGGDATAADLAPVLSGERLPALRYLGLEDSEIADEIAAAVAGAPVVARLESLSLAMGLLSDEGAEALLSGQPLTHLKRLDLHHHYLTDAMMERVRTALPEVLVDLDKRITVDDGYVPYVAHSE